MNIIHAKQKPIDQLPPWALCCDVTRRSHAREIEVGTIEKIRSDQMFIGETKCGSCGRVEKNIKFAHVIGGPFDVVAVELFDLDEGLHGQ